MTAPTPRGAKLLEAGEPCLAPWELQFDECGPPFVCVPDADAAPLFGHCAPEPASACGESSTPFPPFR